MRRLVPLAAMTCVAVACGENGPSPAAGDSRLRVVTTVAPITSIVAAVAGSLADVDGIVPEGSDSHAWDPPPSAARALAQADLVFVNGLGLEMGTRRLAEANVRDGVPIVALGEEAITPDRYRYDRSFPRSGGRPNPHLWTSPPLAQAYARVAARALADADPANRVAYERNAAALVRRLGALDEAMKRATESVPAARRKLLTYHDAFAYFAARYGWTIIGAIQPSSFDEPTARDVARLVRQVQDEGVPAIFGSEVFPSPVLERIGREAGVRYVDVLRDDDLPGRPGDAEHTLLGLLRFDFVTMVEALGGDASALHALDVRLPVHDGARYAQ